MARSELPANITLEPRLGMFEPEDLIYLALAIGLALYGHWIFLAGGLPAIYKYNRFRAKKPRGYTLHAMYGMGVLKLRGYPLGTQRIFRA